MMCRFASTFDIMNLINMPEKKIQAKQWPKEDQQITIRCLEEKITYLKKQLRGIEEDFTQYEYQAQRVQLQMQINHLMASLKQQNLKA